jgi:hypothetical protein
MYVYILLVQMNTIVITVAAAVMAMLVISIVTVSTTVAVTDNNNTGVRTEAVENDSSSVSSVIEADGSSDNNESAKSGINTTVCGSDAAHACQTSSGE